MWTIPRVHKEQRIVQVSVILFIEISSVQFSRLVVSDSSWPHESQHARPPCSSPTPGVHWDSHPSSQVMPFSHLIFCRPLLLLPPIPPNESTLRMRWPKYWSFSFRIIPSKEIPGLISFRLYCNVMVIKTACWFDLLAVQEILKSLPQHHSS